MKEMWRGAEAVICMIDEDTLLKKRVRKGYRIKEIDERLRRTRTKKEFNIMRKLSGKINVPKVFGKEEYSFKMEFIHGALARDILGSLGDKEIKSLFSQIGAQVRKMHDESIVHGDLTTSNMIVKDGKVFFIDFSLGGQSSKIEDKAVDLHLIKQALIAKHNKVWKICFESLLLSYKDEIVIGRLKAVEKRGRKKSKKD